MLHVFNSPVILFMAMWHSSIIQEWLFFSASQHCYTALHLNVPYADKTMILPACFLYEKCRFFESVKANQQFCFALNTSGFKIISGYKFITSATISKIEKP